MNLTTISLLYVSIISVAFIAISVVLKRKLKESYASYFLADRSISGLVNGLAGMSCYLSEFLFLGMTGAVYVIKFPFMGILYEFAISIAVFLFLLAPYIRRSGYYTLIDLFHDCYGREAAALSCIVTLWFCLVFFIGQMKALGVTLEFMLQVPYDVAVIIGGAVLTTYTVIGGMYGVAYNQFIQGAIMLAGILIPLLYIMRSLGLTQWWNPITGYAELTPFMREMGFFEVERTAKYYLSTALVGLGALAGPHVFSIAARGRSSNEVRGAVSWMTLFIGLVYSCAMGCAFVGSYWASVAGIEESKADYVLFMMSKQLCPNEITGLLLAGGLCAAISTLSALVLFASTVIVHDLYSKMLKRRGGTNVALMRLTTAILGVVCVALALRPPMLLVTPILWGWELLASAFVPSLVATYWWKKASKPGILASITVGAVLTALTQKWTGPVIKVPFYGALIAMPSSTITLIATSLLTNRVNERLKVDQWHGWRDYKEERYGGKAMPLALLACSIALLTYALAT